jgi:DsbC/DsbD-like thiol-disulfide interchange protein
LSLKTNQIFAAEQYRKTHKYIEKLQNKYYAATMKKYFLTILLTIQFLTASEFGDGHAKVELLVSDKAISEKESIRAVVKITYEPGWHGYWENPGEGGMKTKVDWKLPSDLKVNTLQFPAPRLITTGNLFSYGYEGEIMIPVVFETKSKKYNTKKISGNISWLACNEQMCALGKTQMMAKITSEELIQKAFDVLPIKTNKALMTVSEEKDKITIIITSNLNLENAEIFPVNEQIIDPSKVVIIKQTANRWAAEAKKSEYFKGNLNSLRVVICGNNLPRPISLTWEKSLTTKKDK